MTDSEFRSWAFCSAPHSVTSVTSGTGATYQAAAAAIGKLHCLTSPVALRILRGTGSSVTATSGLYWPAGREYYFFPRPGKESVGFIQADGTAFDSTDFVTVGIVEDIDVTRA